MTKKKKNIRRKSEKQKYDNKKQKGIRRKRKMIRSGGQGGTKYIMN